MAVRYSGDVEVRLGWNPRTRVYQGSVRDPYVRFSGKVVHRGGGSPRVPEAYDAAALELIKRAERWSRSARGRGLQLSKTSAGRVRLRRVFQAPCPVGG